MRRTRRLPRRPRTPMTGHLAEGRSPTHSRSKYARAVGEAIRRAGGADGTRAGSSQNSRAAVVRSVSGEGAVRFCRRRRSPLYCQMLAHQTKFIVASLNLWHARPAWTRKSFGQFRTLKVRDTARLVHSASFHKAQLTR